MADQATEQSVESRLASFFTAPEESPADTQPEVAQSQVEQGQEDVEPVQASADESEQPDEQQEAAPDSDYVDIELEGQTYRVPPAIQKAVMQERDYTRKAQEVAETARMVQAREQAWQMQQQFNAATAQDQQALQQLEHQIQQFKQLNWAELDSGTAMSARMQLDQLREQANDIRQGLNYKSAQFQQAVKQQRDQQMQAGMEYLRKAIPKFDAEVVGKVRQYAIGEGYSAPEIEAVNDPRFVKLLWKAQQYDTLKASQKSAVEKAKAAPPVIKPGPSQGQNQIAANKYREQRDRLRKSGRLEDAAALFMGLK